MNERGLRKNEGDQRSLRHGRERHVGFTFENEFFQPMPMFFSAEGNSFPGLQGNFRGASAFLICGGPSFGELDHTPLHNCYTMALNNSPKTFRPNAWVSVDQPCRFLKSIWLDPTIMKFVPFDHTEKELWNNTKEDWGPLMNANGKRMKARECPNIVYYRRNEKFEPSRWLFEYTFNWGDHKKWGGGRSCMLAALKILFVLGFRNVYLLGCDLKMDKNTKYHFDEERNKGSQNGNMSTYNKMIKTYYPQLKPYFDKFGYNVYNCNPDSRLKEFPFVPYEEAIKRARGPLNIDDEMSWGMYRTFEEKMKALERDRKNLREKGRIEY
jgi:hypothetical protein